MKIVKTPSGMQSLAAKLRRRGRTIGFVPTMGALHEGHVSLIRRSRLENDRTVVSIFVNPLQFGPAEDFGRYPRPVGPDNRLCLEAGVDFLYRPEAGAMYPAGFRTRVEVQGLSGLLCGRFRPGHFSGVATVVLKLLEAVGPDRAYFGEKDYQQLTILRRMARDLNLAPLIVGCPTVREEDGLALSSRNAYLKPEERRWAPVLYEALASAAAVGSRRGAKPAAARAAMLRRLKAIPGARVDYAEIVDAESLEPARKLRGVLRVLAAVRVGKTRLIDNIPLICDDASRA